MPIYEFACPKCRVIFNFLSQRVSPKHLPTCPKCGNKKMAKQMSAFAMPRRAKESSAADATNPGEESVPNLEDPRLMRAMSEIERDMSQLDENNPRHMAHMMRKMQDLMPPGSMPKEMETAIKRLEAGEDPEKIEADMGDILGNFMGEEEGGSGGSSSNYSHDSGLYNY
ncbi:MAG: CxxC CxxC superfamily protein [Pedosphaera sp.]|nr:CxxC CxxC superfamily protein [Pedosphaera sp.]